MAKPPDRIGKRIEFHCRNGVEAAAAKATRAVRPVRSEGLPHLGHAEVLWRARTTPHFRLQDIAHALDSETAKETAFHAEAEKDGIRMGEADENGKGVDSTMSL